jgi:hypothetical protein
MRTALTAKGVVMWLARLAVLAVAFLATAARSESSGVKLDVKPGLWEMKSVTSMKSEGEILRPDLSKLPPDQRARVEAMLQERMSGKPRTSVWQSCVTEEEIKRGFDLDKEERRNCKRQVLDESARHMKFTESCAPGGDDGVKTEGAFELTAKGGDAVTAQGEMKFVGPKQAGTVKFEFSGRRLGSSCGDLKPKERRKISGD